MTFRTRFAPSPTGFLHVGGARTALFAWLEARRRNGEFVLRIEDTDRERSTEASVQAILDGLQWLGLDWDEGPIYQTHRFDRYAEVVGEMLADGRAYRCDCPKDRLERLREEQMAAGIKPRYDGRCRDRDDVPVEGSVVRFRNPDDGTVVFEDKVRGRIEIANAELDDLVIARPDGTPTYNFTVVVDDMDMAITEVIRGDDHINNTPRQINIYRALGAQPPVFAHVPMILGDDGARLSKRHGAVSVLAYRDAGYLPEALMNYLVRLGWSHGDQEVFTRDEMIEHFDIGDVNRKASAFNTDKLDWLNQQWMRELPAADVGEALAAQLAAIGVDVTSGPPPEDVVTVQAERVHTLKEMAEQSRVFFEDFEAFDEAAAKKHLRGVAAEPLEAAQSALAELSEWTPEVIDAAVRDVVAQLDIGFGKLAQPLRVSLVGSAVSPSIDKTAWLVGKPRTIERIDRARAYIADRMAG